jgi:methylenetetrahydrofolate reductase (NADPH)
MSAGPTPPSDSRLAATLGRGRFAITAEITPPVSADPAALMAKAAPLKGLADAVNVTDGARAAITMSSLAAASLLLGAGIEPVLQVTCRDRNRIALSADLLGASALGIRNILVLRGDNPAEGDNPDAKPVFDWESRDVLANARRMRDEALLPAGQELKGAPKLFLGAADMPIDPPAGWKPDGLAAKVAAGAQFVQTQFCFDTAVLRRYVARLAEAGLTDKLHILIGIGPLASARSARWIGEKLFGAIVPEAIIARMEGAADQKAEGIKVCAELLQELSEIKGIAGAHLMAPVNPSAIAPAIEASGLLKQRATA